MYKQNGLELYLAEVYTKNPLTGEAGWNIEMVWVKAKNRADARNRLANELPDFDCVITLTDHCEICNLRCATINLDELAVA